MQVTQTTHGYRYEQDDWRVEITDGREGLAFEIVSIATGGFVFESGVNLDRLAALIVAAKADAVARGLNWENK